MHVSIVVNYYNNQRALQRFLKAYQALSKAREDFFELVLVDDHSPEPIDLHMFNQTPNVRLFRVEEDVPWNMPAARNIGALEARGRLILFSDVDHILEVDELDAFVSDSMNLPLGTRLTPGRKRLEGHRPDPDELQPNINVFLIRRQDFFRTGGYEEMFAGHYSQEDKYFRYCCKWNGIKDEQASFRMTAVGGSTSNLNRDKSRNEAMLATLVGTHTWKPRKTFQSAYAQLL